MRNSKKPVYPLNQRRTRNFKTNSTVFSTPPASSRPPPSPTSPRTREGHPLGRSWRLHPHLLPEAPPGLRRQVQGAQGQRGQHHRLHFSQRRLRHESLEGEPQYQRGGALVVRWERRLHQSHRVRARSE